MPIGCSNCEHEALNIEGHTPWFLTELTKAGITVDYIRREIARDEYLEEVAAFVRANAETLHAD